MLRDRGALPAVLKTAVVVVILSCNSLSFGTISNRWSPEQGDAIDSEACPSARAKKLHASLLIVDLHADSLLWSRDLLIDLCESSYSVSANL